MYQNRNSGNMLHEEYDARKCNILNMFLIPDISDIICNYLVDYKPIMDRVIDELVYKCKYKKVSRYLSLQ